MDKTHDWVTDGTVVARPIPRLTDADLDRFLARVLITPHHWLWTPRVSSTRPDAYAYGRIRIQGQHYAAHRVAYEHFVGPIPQGLVLDHACREPRCVKPTPAHLEPVTPQENVRRGALWRGDGPCRNGHPMTGDNVWHGANRRRCRACRAEAERARKARLRAVADTDTRPDQEEA